MHMYVINFVSLRISRNTTHQLRQNSVYSRRGNEGIKNRHVAMYVNVIVCTESLYEWIAYVTINTILKIITAPP